MLQLAQAKRQVERLDDNEELKEYGSIRKERSEAFWVLPDYLCNDRRSDLQADLDVGLRPAQRLILQTFIEHGQTNYSWLSLHMYNIRHEQMGSTAAPCLLEWPMIHGPERFSASSLVGYPIFLDMILSLLGHWYVLPVFGHHDIDINRVDHCEKCNIPSALRHAWTPQRRAHQ